MVMLVYMTVLDEEISKTEDFVVFKIMKDFEIVHSC